MPREPVDRGAQVEQAIQLPGIEIGTGQLRQAFDRCGDVLGPDTRERLRYEIDLLRGEVEGLAHLPDRHPGPERVDHAADRGLLRAVGLEDVSEDVLPAM